MPDWVRTQDGSSHSLEAQLADINGPLDLPPGTTLTFAGRLLGANGPSIGGAGVVVRAGAQPDDPNRGFVRYDLSDSDVINTGIFYCLWYILLPNTTKSQPFPEDGPMVLLVMDNV